MLKLNLVLISMLASATALAQDGQVQDQAQKQEMTASARIKFSVTLKRDAELSKDGVTVYNTKIGKTDKYGRDKSLKNMESKLEFGGGFFRKVSVDGDAGGFETFNTAVTLYNSSNKALGAGLVDHAEPETEYTYEKTDKGFVVSGDNFVNLLELTEKREKEIGRSFSMVGMVLPTLQKEDLEGAVVTVSVPKGLVCIQAAGKTDTFNCTLEILRSEKVLVTATPELLAVYEKVATVVEAEQKEKSEEKKKEAQSKKRKSS